MTNPATPEVRIFAERLLALEVVSGESSNAKMSAAFRVCERLRQPLTAVAGAEGFRALLLRALTLAKREAPSLSAVQVDGEGSLVGLGDEDPRQGNSHHPDGEVILIAQLIGLLFVFIGEELTVRFTQGVWPDTSFITARRRHDEA